MRMFQSDDGNSYSMSFDVLICRFVIPYSEWGFEEGKLKLVILKREKEYDDVGVYVNDKLVAYVAGQHKDVAKVYMSKICSSCVTDVGSGKDPKYAIVTLQSSLFLWETDRAHRKNLPTGYQS